MIRLKHINFVNPNLYEGKIFDISGKNIFNNVSPCICNYLLRVLKVQIEISCHKNNNMQQEILINAMD